MVTQADFRIEVNQQLGLAFDPCRAVLFDAENEEGHQYTNFINISLYFNARK